ncbi:Hsp20/alpha crystallin family protein [Actinomycetospora cinnamomea]|uniref:HSP20 family protein n=1 Tax=Actinomycetospora cinnamomea TaxID=663609 RepID=A0A2U1F3T5_9PSEU|nr:Hsp20/alpha crystallin family protein [Actinomycetospora cinnamomea]PVZ06836.1 HSP20 family protein [Actinomycetospora cinnamomea]
MGTPTRARRTGTEERPDTPAEAATDATAEGTTPEAQSESGTAPPEASGGVTGALLRGVRAVGGAMSAPVTDSLLGRRPRASITVDERVDEDTLVVEAELPGLTPDDIRVAVEGGRLLLRAEREARPGGLRRRERRTGTLSRELALPPHTDPTAITASYADGLLIVRVPLPAPPTPVERVEIPVSHRR